MFPLLVGFVELYRKYMLAYGWGVMVSIVSCPTSGP
jgi:hypothetical protein